MLRSKSRLIFPSAVQINNVSVVFLQATLNIGLPLPWLYTTCMIYRISSFFPDLLRSSISLLSLSVCWDEGATYIFALSFSSLSNNFTSRGASLLLISIKIDKNASWVTKINNKLSTHCCLSACRRINLYFPTDGSCFLQTKHCVSVTFPFFFFCSEKSNKPTIYSNTKLTCT